jgi:hypothetical protein
LPRERICGAAAAACAAERADLKQPSRKPTSEVHRGNRQALLVQASHDRFCGHAYLALRCRRGDPAAAQDKPNILVIFGDDIGQTNVSAYSMGLMGYKTPSIDRIAHEGMMFTDYYAEQSCTAGRSSFITGNDVVDKLQKPAGG